MPRRSEHLRSLDQLVAPDLGPTSCAVSLGRSRKAPRRLAAPQWWSSRLPLRSQAWASASEHSWEGATLPLGHRNQLFPWMGT